jgi:hypothetical protein
VHSHSTPAKNDNGIDAGAHRSARQVETLTRLGDGATIWRTGAATLSYVANFNNGTIDMSDSHGKQVSFTDPSLPPGYAPFDLRLIDGSLFVTFAHRDAVRCGQFDEPPHGFVVEFDPDGELLDRAEFRLGIGMRGRVVPKRGEGLRR